MQPQCPGSSGFQALCLKGGTSHPQSKYSGWKYSSGVVHSISPRARYCSLVCNRTTKRTAFRTSPVPKVHCHQMLPKAPNPSGDTQPSSQPPRPEMWESASTPLPYGQWVTEKCNCMFCISPKPVPSSPSLL